ncbi:MAG: poly(3-hydroxyalkanoate) synthetase, partial [Deltaproteobacteria bacterium HGW-Deltaproteobacteria-1]
MDIQTGNDNIAQLSDWQKHLGEYLVDSLQRSIIFTDILRKRGNNYIKHIRSGQPPVLTYNYEMILNAKNFERPANYALVRISDRRRVDIQTAVN